MISFFFLDKGIIIQSVLPYYVSTNMIRNPAISFIIPTPTRFVTAALKTVGIERQTNGYYYHTWMAYIQNFWVRFFIDPSLNTSVVFARMRRFREGCYKKRGLDPNPDIIVWVNELKIDALHFLVDKGQEQLCIKILQCNYSHQFLLLYHSNSS